MIQIIGDPRTLADSLDCLMDPNQPRTLAGLAKVPRPFRILLGTNELL